MAFELTQLEIMFKALRFANPQADIHAIAGNHEERLEKFLNGNNVKALRNLDSLKIENLLKFEKYNIYYHPYVYKLNKNFMLKHGHKLGEHPAKGELRTEQCSGMSGHAHRFDTYVHQGFDTKRQWWSVPGLFDQTKLTYSKNFRWNKGLAFIQYDNKNVDVEIIHENKGKFFCKYNQKMYGVKR